MSLRDTLKSVLPRVNALTERAGVHLEPVHYYSNVPNRAWLRANREVWQKPFLARGMEWSLDDQLAWLQREVTPHLAEVDGLRAFHQATSQTFGPGYGPIESQVLHGFVRSAAPARIVEVGSGVSTALARAAAERNRAEGRGPTAITCIEPFPKPALRALEGIDLHVVPCQLSPPELFGRLERGDLLFIDSTHAVRTGSELPFLYLDVIPDLPPGVFIHVHDIYLPYLFSPLVLDEVFDWQETVLLAALLTHNDHLRVRCCLSALHHGRQAELAALLPDYRPAPMVHGLAGEPLGTSHFPSSIWLETT